MMLSTDLADITAAARAAGYAKALTDAVTIIAEHRGLSLETRHMLASELSRLTIDGPPRHEALTASEVAGAVCLADAMQGRG